MNELTRIYKNQPVRIVEKDGDLWFVAKDVAEILGYSSAEHMTRRLDDDERGKLESPVTGDSSFGHGGARWYTIINESGLYNSLLGSKKPEAKDFKRWITHDVLPTIRRTGAYSIQPSQPPMLTTDAQCKDVMKRMKEEVDKKLEDLVKLEGSQNRTRLVSIIPKLTDFMCESILTSVWRRFGIKPEEEKGE